MVAEITIGGHTPSSRSVVEEGAESRLETP